MITIIYTKHMIKLVGLLVVTRLILRVRLYIVIIV